MELSDEEELAGLGMLITERGRADQPVAAEMSARPETNITGTIVGPSKGQRMVSLKRLEVPWVSQKRGVLKVAKLEVALA